MKQWADLSWFEQQAALQQTVRYGGVWDFSNVSMSGDETAEQTITEPLIECADGKKRTANEKQKWENELWDHLKAVSSA